MSNIETLEITREGHLSAGTHNVIDEERGQWVFTHTGAPFFIFTPRAEDIEVQTIAQSLSKQCRYNGHLKDSNSFCSVAQHSVNVSLYKPDIHPREKLLHDAPEAWIGDLVRPLKRMLKDYSAIEERIEKAVCERFGLVWPLPIEVLEADNIILATEKRDLLLPSVHSWGPLPEPLPDPIVSMTPAESYHLFLDRFEELFDERVPRI